jgi:hypothetical protein
MENARPRTIGEMTSEEIGLLLCRLQQDVQAMVRELESRIQRQNELKKELNNNDNKAKT